MSLTKEQGERLGRCFELFLTQLNRGADPSRELPWRMCHDTGKPRFPQPGGLLFSISQKARPGEFHPNGHKFRTWDGPDARTAALIEQVAQTDDELVDRLRQFVFEGVRPVLETRGPQPGVDPAVAERLVQKIAELEQKLAALSAPAPQEPYRVPQKRRIYARRKSAPVVPDTSAQPTG